MELRDGSSVNNESIETADLSRAPGINQSLATTITLHQEILDINKTQQETCDLNIRKETITVNKTITVPITYEELVIEKKMVSPNGATSAKTESETTRIPLSTESIEVIKHPIQLETVNVYKREVQEIKHIEETVKREELRINNTGTTAKERKYLS